LGCIPRKDAVCHVDRARGELYNLADDPWEWENLYDRDDLSPVREQLKTELLMHLAVSWAKAPYFYESSGPSGLK